jgi:hypothetical protein
MGHTLLDYYYAMYLQQALFFYLSTREETYDDDDDDDALVSGDLVHSACSLDHASRNSRFIRSMR